MQNVYRFALLHTALRHDAERQHNNSVLGPATLGVEVTVPALAARCGLGNIDPQHSGAADARAAVEVCLDHQPLPLQGSWLVTIRPDLDAFGGMAIFNLRKRGLPLEAVLHQRVRSIARQDGFAFGPWPGPKPLPSRMPEFLELQPGGASLAPLAAAAADHSIRLEQRIAWIARWLLSGDMPEPYLRAAERRAVALMEAIASGAAQLDTAAGGRIAIVRGEAEGLLRVGYHLAPVVVALNPCFRFRGGDPHAKFTVAQYQPGRADLSGVVQELSGLETGWGGSPTIIGSPQDHASHLSLDVVVAAVEKRLLPQ